LLLGVHLDALEQIFNRSLHKMRFLLIFVNLCNYNPKIQHETGLLVIRNEVYNFYKSCLTNWLITPQMILRTNEQPVKKYKFMGYE